MNPILENVIKGIYDQVKPELQPDFKNAVKAGMKIMFDPSTHQNMELVKNPESRKDPVGTISKGIAGLGLVMYMQSGKQMSPDVLVPALVVLMCHAFDYAEQAYGIKVDNAMVAETTKRLIEEIFKKLGVQPEHLQEAIQRGYQEIKGGQQQAPQGDSAAAPSPEQTPMMPLAGGQ